MNKKLLYVALAVLSLSACRGRSQSQQFVEEEVEYKPLVTDSAAIDSINSAGMADVDAEMEYPDMPTDQKINMKANDDEIKGVIDGTGDGDMTKEEGNY
jgi:hypothetical protein